MAATSGRVDRLVIATAARLPWFAGAARTPPQVADARLQLAVRRGQLEQIALQLLAREVARVQPHQARAPGRSGRHQSVPLEAAKGGLHAVERDAEQPGQLARIALFDKTQRQQRASPRLAAE